MDDFIAQTKCLTLFCPQDPREYSAKEWEVIRRNTRWQHRQQEPRRASSTSSNLSVMELLLSVLIDSLYNIHYTTN